MGAGEAGRDASGAACGADTAGRLSLLLAEIAAPPPGADLAAWSVPARPGDRLDRFELRAELGRGGFGAVFEAWDPELGRAVALKTLRPGRTRAGAPAGDLQAEAEAVAKLNHPGIVTLHDVCRGARGPYLVMERLEGRTLAARLREGALPWREAVRIASEMAEALGELEAIASPAAGFHRGEILAALGRHREAVEAFRRFRRLRLAASSTGSFGFDAVFFSRSLHLEALSLEALGAREEARRVNAHLLGLWRRADPDLPLLAEARALERRLRP